MVNLRDFPKTKCSFGGDKWINMYSLSQAAQPLNFKLLAIAYLV